MPFGTIFALKRPLYESHHSKYNTSDSCFPMNRLIVVAIAFDSVQIAFWLFAIRCWGGKISKFKLLIFVVQSRLKTVSL